MTAAVGPRAALVTGGTSGIGLATALLLHRRGYRVAVTGSSAASVERARADLPADILALVADSRSVAASAHAIAQVGQVFGQLTTLFLNAGIARPAPLARADEATFDELFATNTKGAFFTLQHALPLLVDGASVVITVGIGASRGVVGGSLAAGSRGALLAMVPSLALELAPRRIRVNAVSPGPVDTPIWARRGGSPDEVDAVRRSVAETVPFGRLGTADEIAETVAFLASDGAAYITGQEIVVAGGGGLRA